MTTTLTVKGQVTIPKKVRDALKLAPGDGIEFKVSPDGQIVIFRAGAPGTHRRDRFESVRGKAQVKWRTDELMTLLRGAD